MRVLFAGTPEFARLALQELHEAGHEIVLVLTQPDRPAGRGMKLQASAVKQYAVEHALPVAQPRSLKLDGKYPQDAADAQIAMREADADVMVVAAYGLILPQWVLDAQSGLDPAVPHRVRYGCLNIHGSLLPRWRGAAPIHRAIEAGDTETGVTIMQMDAGLDTGDMLLRKSLPIADTDTTGSLHDKVAVLGAEMIAQALAMAAAGTLTPQVQPAQGITYAHKIEKHEAAIDWQLPAAAIARRVRAFNPFPAASLEAGGEVIKVWRAGVLPQVQGEPGQVLAATPDGIDVATGEGALRLLELQRPGGKRLATADFLRGFNVPVGTVLVGDAPVAGR